MNFWDFCSQHSLERLRNLIEEQTYRCSMSLDHFRSLDGLICNPQEQIIINAVTQPGESGAVLCNITINGRLQMPCQRCLGTMSVVLSPSVTWVLTDSGCLPDYISSDVAEPLVFAEYTGILDLVEQELVLSVPMVAKHVLDSCPAGYSPDLAQDIDNTEAYRSHNKAFDILQSLKI